MRGLEFRLKLLEHKFVDKSYATLQIPFESTEDDKEYLVQKHVREHGKLSALTVFITNYCPEFKEQFALEKAKYRNAA